MTPTTTTPAMPRCDAVGRPGRHESGDGTRAQPSAPSGTGYGHEAATGPRFKLRVLRHRCIDCVGSTQKATRCDETDCSLHDYRTGHRPKGYKANRTPMRALRAYCLWCGNDSPKEVRLCPTTACQLWSWRMGRATGEDRPDGDDATVLSVAGQAPSCRGALSAMRALGKPVKI